MSSYHINSERWQRMDIFSQMGNIYSEVGRAFSANRRQDAAGCKNATARAIDLFDATIDGLSKQRSPRVKEVVLAKGQFLKALDSKEINEIAAVDQYFSRFALVARVGR